MPLVHLVTVGNELSDAKSGRCGFTGPPVSSLSALSCVCAGQSSIQELQRAASQLPPPFL